MTTARTRSARLQAELGVEFEVPPITRCSLCGQSDCDGCAVVAASSLDWESARGEWHRCLWQTVRQSVSPAAATCLDVHPGRLGPAFRFALLAELGAVGSLGLVFNLLTVPLFSVGPFAHAETVLLFGFVVTLGAWLFMVLTHALWGIGLELALRLAGADWQPRRSLAFALYACGWDLLTSPLGLLLALRLLGAKPGFNEVRAALDAPMATLRAYVTSSRGISADRATVIALGSFALPFLLTVAVVVGTFAVALALSVGYGP